MIGREGKKERGKAPESSNKSGPQKKKKKRRKNDLRNKAGESPWANGAKTRSEKFERTVTACKKRKKAGKEITPKGKRENESRAIAHEQRR